jgi:hypothetical protein
LVSLILCVNFSTKFRLIEISFSGGHFYYSRHFETQRQLGNIIFDVLCHGGTLRNRATSRAESRNTIFNDLLKQEPTRKWPLSNCFSPRIKLFSFYRFDLRAIESSILFAVFCPLRNPVLNGQSSHI